MSIVKSLNINDIIKVKLNEVGLANLQNLTQRKITYEEIAKILGVTRSAVQNRVMRKSPLKEYEVKRIDSYYSIEPEDKENYTDLPIICVNFLTCVILCAKM